MSTGDLLLTGATGAVGAALLPTLRAAWPGGTVHVLARQAFAPPPGVRVWTGDLADDAWDGAGLPAVTAIVHAAASTRFRAPEAALAAINVGGTARLLRWAESLPVAPRFIQLSTLCVAGDLEGEVAEAPLPAAPGFLNAYEASKWRAEGLALASPLRPEIVRLAIVAGDETSGGIAREGALHTALRWFRRGLLPLVPGRASSPVDLISTDLVARFVTRLLITPAEPGYIYHLSAGDTALDLADLLALAARRCRARDARWARGQFVPPAIASRATFAAFRASVHASGDAIFNEVIASADAFLPVLLHPKRPSTARAEARWGGPLPRPDTRDFVTRVIDHVLAQP